MPEYTVTETFRPYPDQDGWMTERREYADGSKAAVCVNTIRGLRFEVEPSFNNNTGPCYALWLVGHDEPLSLPISRLEAYQWATSYAQEHSNGGKLHSRTYPLSDCTSPREADEAIAELLSRHPGAYDFQVFTSMECLYLLVKLRDK